MSRYLLDTNICIYVRRGRPTHVRNRFRQAGAEACVLSVVTYGELRVGAEKSVDGAASVAFLDELVRSVRLDPLPVEAGLHYGRIRADLERRGEIIGNNDIWIAAHALAAGLVLVTNDEREFRRVPGLMVENWAA